MSSNVASVSSSSVPPQSYGWVDHAFAGTGIFVTALLAHECFAARKQWVALEKRGCLNRLSQESAGKLLEAKKKCVISGIQTISMGAYTFSLAESAGWLQLGRWAPYLSATCSLTTLVADTIGAVDDIKEISLQATHSEEAFRKEDRKDAMEKKIQAQWSLTTRITWIAWAILSFAGIVAQSAALAYAAVSVLPACFLALVVKECVKIKWNSTPRAAAEAVSWHA